MTVTSTNDAGGNRGPERDIAIIGMAGRFPGARDVAEYWANLLRGHESIRRLSEAELLQASVPRREFASPEYVPVCPVLDDIDKFDAAFFGISPRDASVMDPAHRLFLEVAWQALENSGNTGLPREGRVGVFASSGAPLYWMNNVRSHRDIAESMGEFLVRHTGNDMNFLATRVSYDLDLRGPSINVQTACSSGLVAVHLARQSLLAGECDMALIGGSTVVLPMGQGYHWKEGEILSPDGHCRPYDHRSAGTVFGSGSACVVLKRLGDALDHGDTIIAVIKGSAVNNDGAVRVGYLAPGVDGQAAVIRSALQAAGVPARSIGYVEGHGTGTSVGDPIELTALEQAFRAETADRGFCGIGSVKSNIGHLGEAAGVASLIKVALALQQRVLPATLGYEAPNPRFAMADSPFHVIDRNTPWRSEQPLRAGITALGAGGTNCHVVLEEPPPPLAGDGGRDRQLLVLSARTKSALDRMSQNLATHLEQHPDLDLGDVAYTLALGRRTLGQRRVLAVADRADAIALLRGGNPARVANIAADTADPGVVFTFPGGGAQYARMCLDLHRREPAFRAALDECLAIVDRECSPEIRGLLFAEQAAAESATARLQQPSLTLPALFAVEYALARLFESWGLRPVALVGHSMGEYVAACLAGVFGLRDGLRLVSLRGRLFERTQPGRMVGISLAEAEVRALMPAELGIAAVNAPGLCVASGPREAIERFCAVLTEREIDWTPIHIDVAAHSALLDPILAEFRAFCRTIPFRAPTIPIASNLTGRWLEPAQAQDPEYWVRHLRSTVRFADCVETILADGSRVFLEIGPGRTLTTLVGLQRTKVAHAFNSVRHPREPADDVEYALAALGKVWGGGADCDWTALYDGQLRNRVPLPGYPFEGQSYWVAPRAVQAEEPTEPHKRENLDQWFATSSWDLAPRPASSAPAATRWLLFVDDRERGLQLTAALRRRGGEALQIVTVLHGRRLRRLAADRYEVGAGSADQYRQLLELLQSDGAIPERIVMWLGAAEAVVGTNGSARGHRAATLDRSCFAPARLAQVMTTVLDRARLVLVSENAFSVAGEAVDPIARTGIGPALVIPRELPDFPTRLVDVDSAVLADQRTSPAAIEQLALELLTDDDASVVVLRTPRRWVPQLRPTRLPPAPAAPEWLRDGDVVFVTGGLGGIGRVLARHLAQQRRIRLALLSREALPPRTEWPAVLADATTAARLRERIEWVRDLERSGTEVAIVRGDVTDRAGLEQAVAEVRRTFGGVHVVIHAAGVMNDAPLQSKTIEQMRQVLAPKVDGTLHLDAVIGDEARVFVVMSSIASLLGLPGQLDYTAANAFLDAFAEARQRCRPGRTLAINWNAWRDVGMVVGGGNGDAAEAPLPAGRTAHPWLDAWEPIADGRRYHTDFAVDRHWLLGEHRIRGAAALIPGTGFVELARAAFVESGLLLYEDPAATAIELRQVTFLRPFQVAGARRRLRIEIRRQGDVAQLAMQSGAEDTLHMTAEVRRCRSEPAAVDLAALRATCTEPVAVRDGFLDQDFVDFGPRWGNLRSIRRGRGEALLELELPAAFAADVGVFVYHPAVADMATGAAQCLIPGFEPATDFLVPFGYDRIVIAGPIGARCTSHVRLRPESTRDAAAFDVRVFDAAGREVVTVHGFTMKRVARDAAVNQAAGGQGAAVAARHNAATEALLREAIAPAEGVIAFDRILAQQEAVQVVASSVDLEVWRRKLAREAMRLEGGDAGGSAPAFSRPALSSDFEAPSPGIEVGVAAIWSKLLGVSDIGAKDDFFELGGNSLIAVRFFTRIKKEFGVTMPLSTLFQFPTIRQLCAAMREQGLITVAEPAEPSRDASVPVAAVVAPPPVPVTPASSEVPAPILIRPGTGAPPLFLVHDGLGEVLLYRSLALLIDPVHAVYGLDPEQQRGRFLHTSIAEMARAKVARMRSVQPRGPYLVAGLCAGGVVAFEIARQLQDAGERVAFVGLIDAAAVGAKEHSLREAKSRWDRVRAVLRPAPGESTLKHLVTALPTVAKKARNWIAYSVGTKLRRRRTAQQVERMRSATETTSAEAQVVQFLELYENAHREHRATGLLRGARVVLYRATAGNGEADDVPFREVYADALLGWQGCVAEPVLAVDIPGGHTSALQEPNVGVLACALQAGIRAALLAGTQ